MKKLAYILILLGCFYGNSLAQVPRSATYFIFKKLATNPTAVTDTTRADVYFKWSGSGTDTGMYRRFQDGSVKRIDSTGAVAFKIRSAGNAYRTDSITIKGAIGTLITQSNDTITVNADSVRASHQTDTLINTLQYVWKRDALGNVNLVNKPDTVIVADGVTTASSNAAMRGKLILRSGNASNPDVIFLGDSGANDHLYMRGRMNNDGYWEIRNYTASNRLAITTGQIGSASNLTSLNLGGAGQGRVGIQMIPVNTLDVSGNTAITSGTAPTMTGTGHLFVSGTLSAGFGNTSAVNAAENIILGIDSDADGIYIGGEYPKDGDNARKMYRQEGVTTTTDVTPTAKAIFGMNLLGDSTCAIMIEVNVVTYRSGGGTPANRGQASYKLIGTFGYENGAVIQIGTTTIVHSAESDAGLDCTLSASGNNIILTFTGLLGETWRWYAYSTRYYAGHISQ